jgi:hypothetical protein
MLKKDDSVGFVEGSGAVVAVVAWGRRVGADVRRRNRGSHNGPREWDEPDDLKTKTNERMRRAFQRPTAKSGGVGGVMQNRWRLGYFMAAEGTGGNGSGKREWKWQSRQRPGKRRHS